MTSRPFLLMLTLIITPSSLYSNTLYFPQVVFGGGYSTTFTIVNTGATNVSSRINLYDQSGAGPVGLSAPVSVRAGGSTRVSLPNTGPLTILWGELAVGSGTVQGVAAFDLRGENGSLITTAAVPGLEAGNSFLLPVNVTAAASTGIAIANVQAGSPVKVGLRLIKEDGSLMAISDDIRINPLGPRRQMAGFVTSMFLPQLIGPFKGTLVVEAATGAPANSLVAAALSVKEGALSALPVVPDGSVSTGGDTLYFPQVPFGGGYSTSFVVMNTGSTNVSSRLNFYDQNGGSRGEYSTAINIPAGGSTRFTLPDTGPLTVVWGEIAAASGTVKGAAAFELRDGSGGLVAAAGMPGVEGGDSFVFPVDVTTTGSTGIAIANVNDGSPVSVRVRLFNEEGFPSFTANDVRLNPLGSRGQIANFVTTLFPELRGTFKGTVVVDAATGAPANALAAAALNVKERGSYGDGPPFSLTALPRELTQAEQKIIGAANTFSLALWGKTNSAEPGRNVFISPLSASFALGMTLNGAANRTFDEMRSALQFGGATGQEINEGYRSLIALLGGIDPAVKFQIANSIWYRNTFSFFPSFLDAAKQYFDAEVRGLDFADEVGSLREINGWVAAKTNNKIPTILNSIDPRDVMFLINAIYFNGNWREKFDPALTRQELFNAANGTTQPMSLMRRRGQMSYVESPAYQAVDLPYGNSAFTMTVVLPKPGNDVESFAASLTPAAWQSLTGSLQTADVDLSLPKLKLTYERTLNDDLKALGIIEAFTDRADFSRMTPGGGLAISFVKQKTFVDIHEEGTEAAAVTVVGVCIAVVCPEPRPAFMRVDRPYIFAIRERLSGAILFMGKIVRMPAS